MFCGSRKTINWGGRRRRCNDCKRSFRVEKRGRKVGPILHDRYVLDRSTYRRVGTTKKRSHVGILKALHRSLEGIIFSNEQSTSGILLLDGKVVFIRGVKYCEHLIWDTKAGLLARKLCIGKESPKVFDDLLQDILRRGIIFTSGTIDGLPGLRQTLEAYGAKVERCHVHLLRDLRVGLQLKLKYKRRHPKNTQKYLIHRYCQLFLDASPSTFNLRLQHVVRLARENLFEINPIQLQALYRFLKSARYAFAHFEDPSIPTTTNRLESYISHFNARLSTMRGFKNPENANRILIALHLSLLKS